MADSCPLSSASSSSAESDYNARKTSTKVIGTHKQYGQFWKKIGLVGSVAIMGGQPVLAQIDIPAEVSAPETAAEAAPVAPVMASASVSPSVPVSPPVSVSPPVVAPETVAPSFSSAAKPTAPPEVETITSQVEIVIPAATPNTEAAAPMADEPDVATPEDVSLDHPSDSSYPEDSAGADPDLDMVTPAVDIVTPSDVVPGAIPTVEDLAAEYGGVFVDPTEYDAGETQSPDAPDVVISERSTGCEYKVDTKNLNGCGESEKQPAVADASKTRASEGGINVGPVNISRSGVRFNGGIAAVASREYYNTVARPLVDLQAGESFVFPLASASPITSLFGWRWHPIHNDYRFHSGTDVGAPQGTPILATQSGQVTVADYLGGYGLTVIMRHADNTLESRYAHMSHILVQPGEWVEQGDVIGLVGSTGNSTGPHLHFELHQLTGQGWVTINPNEVLRYALANLNNRTGGNPLQALNMMPKAEAAPAKASLPKAIKSETQVKDAPHFRPAQPHAQ
ncbi:MAG: M23 family metallopeptidase [Cyanobacteria bacterium P01_B01_bin.77]